MRAQIPRKNWFPFHISSVPLEMTCRVIDSTKCKGLRLLNQIWFRLLGFSYCGLKISIFPSFLCSASITTHSSLIFPPESFCVFIKSIFEPKYRAKKNQNQHIVTRTFHCQHPHQLFFKALCMSISLTNDPLYAFIGLMLHWKREKQNSKPIFAKANPI